jgi:hypothetical protein
MRRSAPLAVWLLALSGCVAVTMQVAELEPRPNVPRVDNARPVVIVLDERIRQEQSLPLSGGASVALETFRGDLKRGFLNGVPGAVKGTQGEARLELEYAEPSLTCFQHVGCSANIKFRGRFVSADGELRFAGTSKSELCPQSFDTCFVGAIEGMYEQIFSEVKPGLVAPKPAKARGNTSEL